MVLNKNKKGQAAIEFLMTYGWMLLVVLIVGALIFSFVDFGSLLPNKVELNNNLRASATESFAWSKDAAAENNTAIIVFTYNGAKRVEISGLGHQIQKSDGSSPCNSSFVVNSDTDVNSTTATGVVFLNGQTGYMKIKCNTTDNALILGDVLEGKITINVESIKTGLKTPSVGPIRLSIS